MPRFTNLSTSLADLLVKNAAHVLLEKNWYFSELADIYPPTVHRGDLFHRDRLLCGHRMPITISAKFSTSVHFLQVYLPRLATSLEEVTSVYAKLVSSEDSQGLSGLIREKTGSITTQPSLSIPWSEDIQPTLKGEDESDISSVGVLKQVFVLVVSKAEHKGLIGKAIGRIIQSSTLAVLARLNYVLKKTIPYWIYSQTWWRVGSTCGWIGTFEPRYYVHNLFFRRILRLKGGPCLHCPTQSECTPQGNINPFECVYMEVWEKRSHLSSQHAPDEISRT
jgi:hypothetical protein|mmetsp:Transcript_86109/g.125983  ORF Transcript_86109/g.125983 Transcript_86109/m.125983 type:complete len:279 (-) Transcript_86109:145-981(-)